MPVENAEEVAKAMKGLLDGWCERRCLRALRHILQGWPLTSGLTDDWGQLLDGLKDVWAFAKDELTEEERKMMDRLIAVVSKTVHRT